METKPSRFVIWYFTNISHCADWDCRRYTRSPRCCSFEVPLFSVGAGLDCCAHQLISIDRGQRGLDLTTRLSMSI
jgi:hypothetical protein